ncbi:VOC family protein [Actinoplanes missouriensis]|uniref:VOC family protein n=1 Tax=Actinoplanes missouriensis TaxID=1866 RepID=UPI0033F55311
MSIATGAFSNAIGLLTIKRHGRAVGGDEYVELRVGGSALGLVQEAGTQVGAPVRIILSAEVADVDALLPAVAAAGGSVPGQANDMPWGQRVAHVLDPDGNMVNLTMWLQARRSDSA